MTANPLLETYLRQLRLPTFLVNYRKFAEDGAQGNLSYDRFLLALAELEVAQREKNRIQRRIKAARFPVFKELADFDFSAIPTLNKAKVIDLARGEYIVRREPILLVGNPGVGKPQPMQYPYRDNVCSRSDYHCCRSSSPVVWADPATGWHHTEAIPRSVLRGLDPTYCGTTRSRVSD